MNRDKPHVYRSKVTQDWVMNCPLCREIETVSHLHQPTPGTSWRTAMTLLHAHLISERHEGRLEDLRAEAVLRAAREDTLSGWAPYDESWHPWAQGVGDNV